MQQISLVGYRACGKSHIARMLARALSLPCIDADRYLENRIESSISQLFSEQGEAVFRDWEERCLAEILSQCPAGILATGGGVVLRPANRAALIRDGGLVVYLKAPAACLAQRLRRNCGNRPSLSGAHPADEVASLLAQREPWYQAVAGLVVDASGPAKQVMEQILAAYKGS